MQAKLRMVDAIIEVHDARVPLTGRNAYFEQNLLADTSKPHILVFNKSDLIDKKYRQPVENEMKSKDKKVHSIMWTDFKHKPMVAAADLIDIVKDSVTNMQRYNRDYRTEYNAMVIGIPNVGKSSLINAVRNRVLGKKGKATRVGDRPGVTMAVLNRITVHENPKIFLIDTPGILAPKAENIENAMKLALCQTVLETTLSESLIADYLLYYLNKRQLFEYVTEFQLKSPTDDIYELLFHIAKSRRLINKSDKDCKPNFSAAANFFIACFRSGRLKSDRFMDFDLLNKS
uniref:Mitochondrial GTPase 1 n=1 Tax=Romanomermis culicivorax TaxID=13658 RepID=A0A915JJ22_ROMCU